MNYNPNPNENVYKSLFNQYEKVIIESLITSFGLDFLIKDQHGGDVDTIHNVRKIGKDKEMNYKNTENEKEFNTQDKYDSKKYHSHKNYLAKRNEIKAKKQNGNLVDDYTGNKISSEKMHCEHKIAAKEINDDSGRVLSGLSGVELANDPNNLCATNERTNTTKNSDTMEEFIDKYSDYYNDKQKAKMMRKDKKARKNYNRKINREYYTSSKFFRDTAKASGRLGLKMGAREVLGFILAEVWFEIKNEFNSFDDNFDLSIFLNKIGNVIKRTFDNIKIKYKEMIEKFGEGLVSGILSSLTTTLCNIFFTTAKNVIKVIRQSYASIIQALKILLLNPDNLLFGDRMRACIKIISTGVSIVMGTMIGDLISKTPFGNIPVLGGIITSFVGTIVTGIMSCTLLNYLDNSILIKKLVFVLNDLDPFSKAVNYYKEQALKLERQAAFLLSVDFNKFKEEIQLYDEIVLKIYQINNPKELNKILKETLNTIYDGELPWIGNFEEFMNKKNSVLVFR